MLVALLSLCLAQSLVLVDAYDSLEFLERMDKKEPPNPIGDSENFPQSQRIKNWYEGQGQGQGVYGYPAPGKWVDLSQTVPGEGEEALTLAQEIQNEYWAIHGKYGATNLGLEDKFYHPAAWAQYSATSETVGTERYKYRYVLDTYFGRFHCAGVFLPPGELVTIEIPDVARNKVGIIYNQHVRNWNGYSGSVERLFATRWETIQLDRVINNVIWPFGAYLAFDVNPDTFSQPIEIFISGVVPIPWFRYGIDTDADWEQSKKNPGLVACLECGNGQFIMPRATAQQIVNPSGAMRFFRSCSEVMEATCVKSNSYGGCGPRPSGRERVPVYWYFDVYVPAGAACAYVGWIFICMPLGWVGSSFSGLTIQGESAWGHLHELGHHHQGGWGIGYTGEVSNNCLVVICYSLYHLASEWRYESGDGSMGYSKWPSGWENVVHAYTSSFGDDDLLQWVSLVHGFGTEKMREFIYSDWNNMYYDKGTYGNVGAYLLRAAVVFGMDISHHLKYNGYALPDGSSCKEAAIEVLENLTKERNLKPWYPIANVFQTGYERNGTRYETARPYVITYGTTKVFNFTRYTKSRAGTWEIKSFRGGRGTWEELSPGCYNYTPPTTKVGEPDEWWLTYHESESDQDVVTYGRIRQNMFGNEWQRMNIPNWRGDVVADYNETYNRTQAEQLPFDGTWRGRGSGMKIEKVLGGLKLVLVKGSFVAPKTGKYTFYVKCSHWAGVAIYLSADPLAYDADIDADFLILADNSESDKDWRGPSEQVSLTQGVSYYYAFIIANEAGDRHDGARVGYKVDEQGSVQDVPADNCTYAGIPVEDYMQGFWSPDWEEIRGLAEYGKGQAIKPEIVSISAPKEQQSRSTEALINGQTNDIYVSMFNPAIVQSFPHLYEFTFGAHTYFETVRLRNITGVANRGVVAKVRLICDGREIAAVDYNSYDEETSILKASTSCTVLGIEVGENSEKWDGRPGGSGFSEIEIGTTFESSYIVPADHPSFNWDSGWESVRAGAYFNGQGKKGRPGATVSVNYGQGCSEVVILGDKTYSTGSSKLLGGGSSASVYINNERIGGFSTDLAQKPETGSTQYKQALFAAKDIHTSGPFTLKIVVDSGEVVLSGALLKPSEVDAALNPGEQVADNAAVVAGAVFGVVAVLALAAIITYFVMKKVGAVVVFPMPIKDDDDD